ncbi:glutathione synthase/RimK-type ligase-like ATP-grasp enzyme [Thermoflavifilum aggregans]|uniref:Glutathione synthase/RimK-type ligase-like ATP-grasp enzyme n=1 Tax=Thermoflavifilum aggregans TaxID=454188 RepID=A0A2M9CTS9_9BACT|nr:hypothetical protein [Thermoflavifilum aggregans]PJJ75327.1 glutathione synthase/RimK-type ligase-like ATP-grasp enzyme [Thermoflavifilum aggregans]
MKKIGLLSGEHTNFTEQLLHRLQQARADVSVENILISHLLDQDTMDYQVIIDLISPKIPFYRWYLKQAALQGVAVCNNPFVWDGLNEWTGLLMARRLHIETPRTAILPSWEKPPAVSERAFGNLAFPLDWENIFDYIGFPAVMMPAHQMPDESNIHFLPDEKAFYRLHPLTGTQVMMLQQSLPWEAYFRCFVMGDQMQLVPYDPRRSAHQRYQAGFPLTAARIEEITSKARKLQVFCGYDFQVSEWAVANNQLYAVRLAQPFHEGLLSTLPDPMKDWLCDAIAQAALQVANTWSPDQDNLRWGKWPEASIHRQAFWNWTFQN